MTPRGAPGAGGRIDLTITYRAKPSELWGVGRGPKVRQRGAAAKARRAAKRAAKAARMGLKAYLRKHGDAS